MKKLLFFFLVPAWSLAQEKINLEFGRRLRDDTKSFKTVTLLDKRRDTTAIKLALEQNDYEIKLKPGLAAEIEKNFQERQKGAGVKDLLVRIEKLEFVTTPPKDSTKLPGKAKMNVQAVSFQRIGNGYQVLSQLQGPVTLGVQELAPHLFETAFKNAMNDFVERSFKAVPTGRNLKEEELDRYATLVPASLPAFQGPVKPGIYKTLADFFNQNVLEGYSLVRNSAGKVKEATKGDQYFEQGEFEVFVENDKPYLYTQASGYLPLEKDEKGFFVNANRAMLLLEDNSATNGLYAFGLLGGIAKAIIDSNDRNQEKAKQTRPIYLDPINKTFIFD